MKRLTAKQLIKEFRSIRKQASSGFFKPYPIDYENEEDLNSSIDSVLLEIVDGFGFLGATNVVVKGDTAYVKVEGEVELDVKQIKPWWENEESKKEFVAFLADLYPPFSSVSFVNGLFTAAVRGEGFIHKIHIDFENEFVGVNNDFDAGFTVVNNQKLDSQNAYEALEELKETIQPWWTSASVAWSNVAKDFARAIGNDWYAEYFDQQWRIYTDEYTNEEADEDGLGPEVALSSRPNDDWMVASRDDDGAIVYKDELSGDYSKDLKYMAQATKKYLKKIRR